ncbi:MAG: class III signal peptide-containing protein [Hadesarchaea archaeon]|nr:class III signal peptide-containing protein [Hadesarchaea archaeon]
MRLSKKGQGATEYLLMLAAVLVIVAIAVYYVTSTGGYPAVAVTAVKYGDDTIRINVDTGSIPAGDWQYIVSNTPGSDNWTDGTVELKAPYFSLGTKTTDNYYVSLKHKPSGHIYFSDTKITIS